MITVGCVFMSIPGAPVKEIMKDMMEMSRGVQHPTRGLFLRHYLSGQTRDHLPVGEEDGYATKFFQFTNVQNKVLKSLLQTRRILTRLNRLRAHKLYRDEQTLGPTPTSRPFSRSRKTRNGTA